MKLLIFKGFVVTEILVCYNDRMMEETIKLIVTIGIGLVIWLLLRLVSRLNKRLHVRFICNLLKVFVVLGCLISVLNIYTDLEKAAAAILTGGGLILAILSFAALLVLVPVGIVGFAAIPLISTVSPSLKWFPIPARLILVYTLYTCVHVP